MTRHYIFSTNWLKCSIIWKKQHCLLLISSTQTLSLVRQPSLLVPDTLSVACQNTWRYGSGFRPGPELADPGREHGHGLYSERKTSLRHPLQQGPTDEEWFHSLCDTRSVFRQSEAFFWPECTCMRHFTSQVKPLTATDFKTFLKHFKILENTALTSAVYS